MKKLLKPIIMLILSVLAVQGQTRTIPHVTAPGGGYQTTIYIENLSNEGGTYRLVPYTAGGGLLRAASGTIEPLSIQAYTPSQLFNTDDAVSHVVITTSFEDITITASYRIADGPGSPAHLSETNMATSNNMIYPGEWDSVFDGLALVNVGDDLAQITLRQVDFDGNEVQTELIASGLPPLAKALYVIGGPAGSAFAELPMAFFELRSTQDLAITALRGTVPGAPLGVLWANEAKPIPEVFDPSMEGLVAYFPLDGDAMDASGNENHGALTGCDPDADRYGEAGHALSFNGRDDFIEVPHHKTLNLKQVTLVAWLKTADATADSIVIGKGDEVPYFLGTAHGRFEFGVGSPARIEKVVSQTQTDGDWHFVAGVFDGTEVRIYVDGNLEDSEAFGDSLGFDNRPLNLGRNPVSEDGHYIGLMDEVRIYARALSQQELTAVQGNFKKFAP